MRKIYLSMLGMVMLSLPIQAQDFTVDSIQYQLNPNKEAEVNVWGFTCTSGILDVPSQVTNPADNKTYTVTGVAGVIPSENWWEDGTPNGFKSRTDLKSVSLPSTVRTIGKNAFEGSSIESISMPDEMDSIESEVFVWCSNLKEVNMPSHLKYLGSYVFNNCLGLTSITLPEGLTWSAYSPSGVFSRCGYLESVVLPKDMKAVPSGFFNGCQNLTEVLLPDSITTIGYQAFLGCLRLESINLPSGVREIGNMAFQDCPSLVEFVASDSLRKISYWAFCNCYSLSRISLSAAVNDIDSRAFEGCSNIQELTVDEANLTYCAKNNLLLSKDEKILYWRPNNLERLFEVPTTVDTIGEYAAAEEHITTVVFPENIKALKENAFYNDSIFALYFQSATPPTIANDMFNLAQNGAIAYVPRGAAEAYRAEQYLNRFEIVEEDELPFIYTSTYPVNGKYLKNLDTLIVNFNEVATLEETYPEVTIMEDSVTFDYTGNWMTKLSDDAKSLLIIYEDENGEPTQLPLVEGKTYQIVIPSGLVKNVNGAENAEVKICVNGPDLLKTVSTTPAEGSIISTLSNVSVTFDADVYWVDSYGDNDFKLYANDVEQALPEGYILYAAMDGSNTIKYYIFNSSYMPDSIELDAGTQYRIVIPAGLIYKTSNSDTKNEEIVINFSTPQPDGIASVNSDSEDRNEGIYTLSGIRLNIDARQLPAGIYIINGKKTIIRR